MQIGNAVPVKLARALGIAMHTSLIYPHLLAKIPMQKKIKDF
jgi:hypothetical protein